MGIIIISTSQVNMTIINSEYEAIVDTQSRWLLLVIKGFSLGAWAVFFFFFFGYTWNLAELPPSPCIPGMKCGLSSAQVLREGT